MTDFSIYACCYTVHCWVKNENQRMMVRGASNLPAVARFPAAFYLLIQRGFVRTPRLHLEPAEESVLHQIQEENHCMLKKKENLMIRRKL